MYRNCIMMWGAFLAMMDDDSSEYTSSEYSSSSYYSSLSDSPEPESVPEEFPAPSPDIFPTLSTAAALLKKNLDFIAAHPKPKRPISGFLKFASHVRPTLVKENPSLNVTQLAKLTASKWKEADESLKKKFSDEYLEDKKKYDTALKEYNAAMSKLDPKVVIAREEEIRREKQEKLKSQEKRAMLKRKADLGQPKKPLSSYLMFLQDQRSEQGELPYKEWVAKMTQKWKNMGESEKQTYQSRYLKAKEEHDESMAKWAKRMCEMGNSDVLPKKLIPSPSTSK